MNELREEILRQSEEAIKDLSAYVAYFEDDTLMKVYLQTQVIHKLFEDNQDIDINKLELFHVQFTSTLLTLLDKIKEKNERAVKMYESEIQVNNEMLEKLRTTISKEGGFDLNKQKQAARMSRSLRRLYVALYEKSSNNPFTEDLRSFSIENYKDHFFTSTKEISDKILTYDKNNTFRSPYFTIDKKLLIALGKANFDISFFAGVNFYPILVEIYKINTEDIYFLYWSTKNLFLKCDIELFPYKEWEAEMSKRTRMIKLLTKNNLKAETNIKNTYRYISHEILELLEDNYKTISDIDFLSSLEDVNTQAEILKSMLDTKML